jgi:Xaa-Pro aminopeptidase
MDFTNEQKQISTPHTSPAEHARRLNLVFKRMKRNSLAIIVGGSEKTRSHDTTFTFRQTSDVLWLTGFPEPDAAIVLLKGKKNEQKVIMFVLPKNQERETWTGFREGPEGAKRNYFANEAHPVEEFEKVIADLIAKAAWVYYKFQRNYAYDQKFRPLLDANQKPLLNPESIIHRERMIKSAEEIAIVRHAAMISAAGHKVAMIRCGKEGASLREYNLRATLHFHFWDNGASWVAYDTIVANGNNACTLHYTPCRDALTPGSLVLIDSACEFEGYASDITRTFPVNGKFSQAQREIYDLVLKAQLAAIAYARAGRTIKQVHAQAEKVLRAGLVKLGVLSKEMSSQRSEKLALEKATAAGKGKELLTLDALFMHGTSHMMGLDVHDVDVHAPSQKNYKTSRMKVGWILTVEPGLYFAANDARMPERYRGIGVRIEDDILISENGCEVLTADVPKEAEEIEALIASGKN